MPDTKTGHIKWGWWEFDYDVMGFEGLTLLAGRYRGHSVFYKFSMPAIRVKYMEDGGWMDWRRPLGKGAGPYADRLRWKLGGEYGLQRISNRGNEYVGLQESIVHGRLWLELGIYARIGAYHIYQAWHVSEDGWILPRVWSKGLTINMDHWHHPYWRLDFDLDGSAPNRVFVRKFGSWSHYPTEANDVKDGDPNNPTVWFVRNQSTGLGAWVVPGPKDGTANSFSSLDVGIRRYVPQEEANPWKYEQGPVQAGPLGLPWPKKTWDWQFDTGELGFLNGEDVSATDTVFWYVSHMFHHAHEGNDHWGTSGPSIQLVVPPRQQHIFYRGKDNAINHIFWDGPLNKLFHDQWTAMAHAPQAAGDPATLVTPNQQHVFYRGLDAVINHLFWDAPSNKVFHDQWTVVVGAPRAEGDPATLAWPNQQHVFYRGADGHINHIFYDAPANKLFHDQWTARTGAPRPAGDPATMVTKDQQHVFYRGVDGHINHIFWDGPLNKLFHEQWTARTNAPLAAGDPATMVTLHQQHVFYRGHDGHINHIFWDGPLNKLFHEQWTARTNAPLAAGDPATLVSPNQQHVFYRGADGHINHIFWDAPTNQLLHDQWSAMTGAPLAVGDPATMEWPDQQHVFYRDASGHMNHIFYHAPANQLFRDQWTVGAGAPVSGQDKPGTMVY